MKLKAVLKTILFVFVGLFIFVALAIAVTWARSIGVSGWVLFVTPILVLAFVMYGVRPKGNKLTEADRRRLEIEKVEQERFLIDFYQDCSHAPLIVAYIGGSGSEFVKEAKYYIACGSQRLGVADKYQRTTCYIPYSEVLEIEISGPGTVSSNAGISGGGFGVEGLVKGALIAATINAATTRSSTTTYLRLMTRQMEVYLQSSDIEPSELRLLLSTAFVKVEANRKSNQSHSAGVSSELAELHALLKDGALSKDEFDIAKKRILSI